MIDEDYEREARESYLRQRALELSVSFDTTGLENEDLVTRANAFYNFMKGKERNDGS